jgi:hypothetical protein
MAHVHPRSAPAREIGEQRHVSGCSRTSQREEVVGSADARHPQRRHTNRRPPRCSSSTYTSSRRRRCGPRRRWRSRDAPPDRR